MNAAQPEQVTAATPGQAAYEAYLAHLQGADPGYGQWVKPFADIDKHDRDAWEAAAQAAVAAQAQPAPTAGRAADALAELLEEWRDTIRELDSTTPDSEAGRTAIKVERSVLRTVIAQVEKCRTQQEQPAPGRTVELTPEMLGVPLGGQRIFLQVGEPQPAPGVAMLLADWRKTADSLKNRTGVGDARERNTLEVVISQVRAVIEDAAFAADAASLDDVQPQPAPELERVRAELGETNAILNELIEDVLRNTGDEWDGDEADVSLAAKYVRWLEAEVTRLGKPQPAPGDDSAAEWLSEQFENPYEYGFEASDMIHAWEAGCGRERTLRLHLAGERDEARSDLARIGHLLGEVLGAFKGSPARVTDWHEKAEAITARHDRKAAGEQPAPELAALREQLAAVRAVCEGASAGQLANTPRGRLAKAVLNQLQPAETVRTDGHYL